MYVLSEFFRFFRFFFLNFIFLKQYFLNSSDLILSQFSRSAKNRGVKYKGKNVSQNWCKSRRGRHVYRSIRSSLLMPFTFPLKSMQIPGKCGQAAVLGSLQRSREIQCSPSKSFHRLSYLKTSLFARTFKEGLIETVCNLRKHSASQLLHLRGLSFIYWSNTNGKQAGVKRSAVIKNKHDYRRQFFYFSGLK